MAELTAQLVIENEKLLSLREKFKLRNHKAGNAKAGVIVDAHGRQKTELSKQRVKCDELKRAVDLAAEAVDLLRKTSAVGKEHILDCVDFENLLDTLMAVCIKGYLQSQDNRTEVPVIRILYNSSLKFTSPVDGTEVGSCEVMDRIIDTVISLVSSSTGGRVRVTDVVTDGEFARGG